MSLFRYPLPPPINQFFIIALKKVFLILGPGLLSMLLLSGCLNL